MRSVITRTFLALLLLGAAASAGAAQQTLTLVNGDQLTGNLIRIDNGTWVFDYGGMNLEIAVANVATFTAPEPVGLRLADGALLAATVQPVAGGLRLREADGTTRTVATADLAAVGAPDALDALRPVAIKLLSPFLRFWRATASFGLSIKDGNTNTRSGTFYLDMERATTLDRLSLTVQLSQDHDRVDGDSLVQTAGKYIGTLRYDVYPLPKLFVFGSTRQSRDRFKEIDLRSFYTAGLGYQFIQQAKLDLRSSVGAGVRHEKFFLSGGTVDSSKTVGTGSLDAAFRAVLGPFDYDLRGVYAPVLNDFNDYQLVAITGLTARVIAGLGFRVQLLFEYDNTPTAGSGKHDTELTTALTYTLGS
jgi:putative salt-induced outer membrane protein